jgi:hypothetical protein
MVMGRQIVMGLVFVLLVFSSLLLTGVPGRAHEQHTATQIYLPLLTGLPGDAPPPPAGSYFLPGDAPTRNLSAAYDSSGRLHVAFVRHTRDADRQEVLYGQCAPTADCDRFVNWQIEVIHSGSIGTVQLAVTANGRPRIAIQDAFTLTTVRLAYMACETNCLHTASWQGIALANELGFGGAFLQHTDQRWFTIDRNGLPHLLISTPEGSYYATCRQTCATDGVGWSLTPLDTTNDPFLTTQLFNPVIRVGGDGRVHILGANSRPQLVYLTCDATCDQAERWQRLVLADYNQPGISDQIPMAVYPANLDLEIDRTGRIVVGFSGFTPGQAAPQRAYLLRCMQACADAANWSGRSFADTAANGLDLVFDPQNRPLWLLIGKRPDTEERLAELATCATGDCFDQNARWSARIISSSNEMETEVPIKNSLATPPVCSVATTSWEHASNQVLFTPNGQLRLLTNAVGTSICQPGMDEWIDQWGTKKRGRTIDVWVFTARARWTMVP